MNQFILLIFLGIVSINAIGQASILELGPSESMAIAGKGPGQDAAINPYIDGNSVAMVENISKNSFSIRIQREGEIIRIEEVSSKQRLEVGLAKGDELYFDSDLPAKVRVEFYKE